MKFDGNRAWNDAVHAVSVNREVLLVMAGVFFFLPGLVAALFLSGYQARMASSFAALVAAPRNPGAIQQMMQAYAAIVPYVIALLLLQTLGYMAMLALLTDARRPTVGEAMAIGARCLPALIGAILVFFLGYVLISLPLGLVLVAAVAMLGLQLGGAIGITIDGVIMLLIVTRLSLTLPVIVIEGLHRPWAALHHSWQITRGQVLRLLGFYLLLGIAYVVISIALSALLNLLAAAVGPGPGLTLVAGAIGGAIAALTSILLTAILAAVHRQLSGPLGGTVSGRFF